MHKADAGYSREAVAYEALDHARHLTSGSFTARYYGS